MINKVIEEALTNLIRRVEDLEESNRMYYNTVSQKKKVQGQRKRGLASDSQLNYIKGLGGEIWDEMTSNEAGEELDRLVKEKQKNSVQTIKPFIIPDPNGTVKKLIEKEGKMAMDMVNEFGNRDIFEKEKLKQLKQLTKEQLKELEKEKALL